METNKKTLIISIVFGLIILALTCLIIYPLFRGIRKSSDDFITAKQDLILFQSRIENLGKIKKTYESWEGNLEKTEELFIDPEIPIDLIEFWEGIAKDLGILIDISYVSLKITEDDPWDSIGFQIIITGSFIDFLRFVEKIENSPYLIEIQNLIVKRLTEQEIKSEKYGQSSLGNVRAVLLTKVYAK